MPIVRFTGQIAAFFARSILRVAVDHQVITAGLSTISTDINALRISCADGGRQTWRAIIGVKFQVPNVRGPGWPFQGKTRVRIRWDATRVDARSQ